METRYTDFFIKKDAIIFCPDCNSRMLPEFDPEWDDIWVCKNCDFKTNWIEGGYTIEGSIRFLYWLGEDTYPFSIEENPISRNGKIQSITVPINKTYLKNGKRYYDMVCGFGTNIKLLVKRFNSNKDIEDEEKKWLKL
jgi:hypothetical protein